MANTPVPKSYEQILGDMLTSFMSKIGVNDLSTGSVVLSFFESLAQAIFRASGDTFSILRDYSVDRASGDMLKRIALDENISLISAKVATSKVTVSDSNFTKISTKVYSGASAPNIGSSYILVSDASLFPATGSIYIGRGTLNIEGPLVYSSIVIVGSYYRINLTGVTTKYHNTSEAVILAQGGTRTIASGTSVKTPTSGTSAVITYTTTLAATILDGETSITDVPVASTTTGSDQNVPANSLTEFITAPFSGATVTNPLPITNGRSEETDDELRNRIKLARISKGLGTITAVESSVLNATATDENATIISSKIFSDSESTILYIDDGNAYEEKSTGVGQEFIVDSALGGEKRFQLATGGKQTSIAKAFVESTLTSPFDISTNDKLAVLVGGVLSTHTFATGDFKVDGAATAYEIVSSINGDSSSLFNARTSGSGTKVVIFAVDEVNEYLQVTTPNTGVNAATALGFPTNEVQTLRLYEDRQPLNRNGSKAIILSADQSAWNAGIATGCTLIVAVDSTANITYTFTDADFVAEGTYSTVSKSNSLASWCNVINAKVVGVTASVEGTYFKIESNLGASARAKLVIDITSTLVTLGMFTVSLGLTSTGKASDYTLSRNTAQLTLTTALSSGSNLTAGTEFTKGEIISDIITGGSVTIASDAYMWFIIDNNQAAIIPHFSSAGTIFDFTKMGSNTVRFFSSATNAFANVNVGDYVIMWSLELNANNRFEGRVSAVGTQVNPFDYFELRVTVPEYTAAVNQATVTFSEGLVFVRSDYTPQKVIVAAGAYALSTLASTIESGLYGVATSTQNDEYITITTNTRDTNGNILLVTYNDAAKAFNFVAGDSGDSITSHFAFCKSQNNDDNFPLFIHSYSANDQYAVPPTTEISSFISAVNLGTLGVDSNAKICMLNPYLFSGNYIKDMQARNDCNQISSLSGTTVNLSENQLLKRIRINDRFYVASPYDFNHADTIITILDNDPSNETFVIPLYRRAIANTTMPINPNSFRAYDVDSGATTTFNTYFGTSFNFANYKALMKARNVIDPVSLTDEDAILYRSTLWGRTGERYNIGYTYPTAANASILSTVVVGSDTQIRISLKSGAAVANNIDGTTEWDITVANNTPVAGVEEMTYTWNTVGTNPAMVTLLVGHYVTINTMGEFNTANIGTFRICACTATSFTVRRPNGLTVAEANKKTLQVNTISLYENSNTTASEIVTYVTNSLSDYITASIVDDNGSTGAGVISLSTYEDNSFVAGTDKISLIDGINWILSSNVSAIAPNPNFTFKVALSLPSFSTNTLNAYAFNNGEEVRLIPTTANQIDLFTSTLAVSGITTLGEVDTAERLGKVQLSSQTLGSLGAVQISGGTGNTTTASIIGTSTVVEGTNYMKSEISRSSGSGLHVDQWVKMESTILQKKDVGIENVTNVTIVPSTPVVTQSTITLGNRPNYSRYFGQPRNNIRDEGRAFHVEYHGSLVCISWDGTTGATPAFTKTVEFNDAGGGDMTVTFDASNGYTSYNVDTGARNFNEVQFGDTVTIINFATAGNNGTFKVVGVSDDGLTVVTDNADGVTAVAAAVAPGDLVFTTQVQEGDTVTIKTPFATVNQGQFRVIRRYGNSIYIDNTSAVEQRVVVTANLRTLGYDGTTEFTVTVPGDMRITWTANTDPTLGNIKLGDIVTIGTDFAVGNRGNFMVTKIQTGTVGNAYIELANSKATAEGPIAITDVFQAHAPSFIFNSYDNGVIGDSFVVTGNILSAGNIGSWPIVEILNKTTAIVTGVMITQTSTPLLTSSSQVYVEEGVEYTGYKKIYNMAIDPANSNRYILIFTTNDQFDKINASSVTSLNALNKLNFSETLVQGLDSYRYNTGLIEEANKIVYGDPRDSITYPGVSAAGAEIFIQGPLAKRITISINVRVKTGVSFIIISEQVRNNIAALINGSPMGESIAISDIIATVNTIPGVKAVSITSPSYSPTSDVIVINPSEKAVILDVTNDIQVSKVE